jgi:hypothetical protein
LAKIRRIVKRRFSVLRCGWRAAIYASRAENLPISAQKSWLIGEQSVSLRAD